MKVIDSSAIIKFFVKEPGWERARAHLTSAITIELALKELGNALWKKVRRNEMRLEDAVEIMKFYPQAINISDQKKYLEKALELAAEQDMTVYDSLFIALAVENNCELITCDRKQMLAAEKLGVRVIEC